MKKFLFSVVVLLFTVLSLPAQKVEVLGNLEVVGGLRLTWVDTSATVCVMPDNIYGLTMGTSGSKILILPTITTANRGKVYAVTNTSGSGNITLTTTQNIDGTDKIQPGRTAQLEANTLGSWVVKLY